MNGYSAGKFQLLDEESTGGRIIPLELPVPDR
jgi:hypothetical protein